MRSPRALLSSLLILLGFALSSSAAAQVEGFEESPLGAFEELVTTELRYVITEGKGAINTQHADFGKRCLWLQGGERTVAELHFQSESAPYSIQFWVERWTARSPFLFQIEAQQGGKWQPLADYSGRARVGGFRMQVDEVLPEDATALRLIVQSPPETGVLIDEVRLGSRTPMQLEGFGVYPVNVPILQGQKRNPLFRMEIETVGALEPLALTEVRFACDGLQKGGSLQHAQLIRGQRGEVLDLNVLRMMQPVSTEEGGLRNGLEGQSLVLSGKIELKEGKNTFWVCGDPVPGLELDDKVTSSVLQVELSDGTKLLREPKQQLNRQRMGVPLRQAGDDSAAVYRIPGLVTTNDGTLIAVYDVRYDGWRDLPGNIDVGMSRSVDGGRSWSPMEIILDFGDDPDFAFDGVGDPAVLVDRETGTIWVAATWHHGNLGWNGSQPGFDPEQTGQLVLTRSDDDGLTWSAPINITRQVKQEEWAFLLQGPGRGITMQDGTLVFPAQYQLSPEEGREPRASVLFSRDHGVTWEMGAEARSNTTEAAVVELAEGELMLNMRDNRGRRAPGARAVAVSSDLGASWQLHPTSGKALPEPVCMASLIHVGREVRGVADGVLLFSNPAVGAPPRRHMSIQASRDYGQTWDARHRVMLDEATSAGYSCLTMIDAETVGILYEGSGAHLVFQRIPLHELGLAIE